MLCPRCHRNVEIGSWPFCPHDPVHPAPTLTNWDKTVILEHPQTGEVRIPGRSDRLSRSEQKYQSLGYVRREVDSGRDMMRLEKRTGLVHESSNYNRSGRAERDTQSH